MLLNSCLIGVVLCIVTTQAARPQERLPIGLILDRDEQELEVAFRATINRINEDLIDFELVPIVQFLSTDESITAKRVVCDLVADGVIAVFGPHSKSTNGIVASVCNDLHIPHILYSWQDEEKEAEKIQRNMTINVYPDTLLLSRAYAELVADSDWKTFIVLYESREGLLKLQDSLQVHKPSTQLYVFSMDKEGPDYRPLLKKINATREINFLIDCSPLTMIRLLKQVEELRLMRDNQNYFFTDLDTHTVDFGQFGTALANISYVQLSSSDRLLRRAIYEWGQYEEDHGRDLSIDQHTVTTNMILMHDSVALLASTLKKYYTYEDWEQPNADCDTREKWMQGAEFVERMRVLTRNKTLEGEEDTYITGRMDLSKHGDRHQFKLDFTIRYGEASKSSSWMPDKGVVLLEEGASTEKKISLAIQNKTFKVTTKLGPPFLFERKSPDGVVYEGNMRYMGYSVDLIQKLSEILKFKYEFVLDPDGKNGEYRKDLKRWNGILGQLIDGNADIGIGDLTITSDRRQVVDFTVPFMSLGISILYATPKEEPPNIFSFLSPFSNEVWVYTAVVFLFVSLLLYAVARISHTDWESPHPCDDQPEEVENMWDMANTTWLTMGSVMTQGSDILPKGVPMRLVVGMWWFFALLLAASYTANLSAFLSKSRIDVTIKSVDDLANQNKIKYGVMKGGSTQAFFRESNDSLYHRMWVGMENEVPSVFCDSNQEGLERVLTGKRKYAFLMESTMIEYVTQKYCDLTEVGSSFGDKFYGIALPLNSRYRSEISTEILRMSERGELYELKNKWWKDTESGTQCVKDEGESGDDSLTIEHVGGCFLVLIIGIALGYIIGIFEFLWHIQDVAVQEKITPWEALKAESLFVLKFWIQHKPVKIQSTSSGTSTSTSSSKSTHSKRSFKSRRSRSRFSENRSVNVNGVQPSVANLSMKSINVH